jgi:Protein of unknown function (DUF3892)
MAQYRIVCTVQEPAGHPHTDAHIVNVETGNDPKKADTKWTLDEVLHAMDQGNVFYTQGERSGKVALVEKYVCSSCRRTYIRSAPDRVEDNNLDSLRRCNWQ